MDDNFFRRLAMVLLTAGFLLALVAPVAAQVDDGEKKPDDTTTTTCPDGKAPDETGNCARPAPQRCWDGSEPKEGSCPPTTTTTTTTTTSPCPDGSDFCGQIASCPISGPLSGSRCEVDVQTPTTTAPPPVPAAPTPSPGNVLGRPTVEGARGDALPPPPPRVVPGAQVAGEQLARTGPANAWLAAAGSVLVALGFAMVRASRARAPRTV